MRNITFYEFLNCRPVGTGAIDIETAKIAYIAGVQKTNTSLTLDLLAISQFPCILFIGDS